MIDFLQDVLVRQWNDLLARPSGPFSFRFILQPMMAAIFAVRDGIRDAHTGRTPFLRAILRQPEQRGPRVREGLQAISRIILLGLLMDAIYQLVVLRKFYPVEAVMITFALACLPYFLVRGPAARISKRMQKKYAPEAK